MTEPPGTAASSRIPDSIRRAIAAEIAAAGGREVLFVAELDDDGLVSQARAVSRGTIDKVLAPQGLTSKAGVIIHNHPSGTLAPSDADLETSAELAWRGTGSWIISNDAERLYIITEAGESSETRLLDPDELAAELEPGGGLARSTPGYEPRQAQVDMLRLVTRGFNEEAIVLCEAGTGVGKSFAYLIPAVRWAQLNGERVVISTATINLQHQLMEKDVPQVLAFLGSNVKFALAKGRNNYLCLNRFHNALEEQALFREDDDILNRIAKWVDVTPTGERSDVSFQVPDALWSRINADADACSNSQCKQKDACFLQAARRELSQAHVIITNHHLFFADASVRSGGFGWDSTAVLPPFRKVIFDEAHSIESSATSYFSRSLSRFSVGKYLQMLIRRKGTRTFGLIPVLKDFLGAELSEAEAHIRDISTVLEATDKAVVEFLGPETTYKFNYDYGEANGRNGNFEDATTGAGSRADLSAFPMQARELASKFAALQSAILALCSYLDQGLKALDDDKLEEAAVRDTQTIIRRLEDTAGLIQDFRGFANLPHLVFWIEKSRLPSTGEFYTSLTATPIDIGPLLQEAVYEPCSSVILTSATLTVQGSFDFLARRIGLASMETLRARFESPFDYANRVLVAVPSDAPEPQSPDFEPYLVDLLGKLIEASGGRALVLFTSYAVLGRVADALQPVLEELGIPAIRQGDDDRKRLLKRFREDISSVLFATDSFWEGVDAPGSSLELVILCRLPFKVPTDPVILARTEAIDRRGGNSFMEFSVPEAVMKFRQGFGRLMRRSDDRGVVVIVDIRVVKKAYGKLFTQSLPETRKAWQPAAELATTVRQFFDSVR